MYQDQLYRYTLYFRFGLVKFREETRAASHDKACGDADHECGKYEFAGRFLCFFYLICTEHLSDYDSDSRAHCDKEYVEDIGYRRIDR